ncbi:MAG: cysteine--tRNA ligase [Ignavibacteria bacterium]|jgi:cysteinyl-tRNA synthetase|nr:cysteine--tRNA ligase [Ignavibacteria bacterium]
MKIKLFNSLSRRIEDFKPVSNGEVRIYSCGPTVYNYAHLGNMRAFLFADLLQKVMKVIGKYKVKWVMNITNIDDKTIRDSQLNSSAWNAEMGVQTDDAFDNLIKLTRFYEEAFIDDIEKLGINRKDFFAMPRATDYIKEMQDLILKILKNDFAYISDGSIYFNVNNYRKTETYGKLFKIDFDNFVAGMRIDSDQYEREQANDFVLWKSYKEGEPFWDFEIDGKNYPGRPGWHIECSAMEKEILGLPFDIHTGGVDLKFPHHEDEIAQSKAGYGIEPTNYWCHNEFLEVEGEKMSKTAGNFFTIRDLEEKNLDTKDIRFALLSAHYRTKYNFTFAGIEAGHKARQRVQTFINSILKDITDQKKVISELEEKRELQTPKIQELQEKIFSELANDLHTPKALANLFLFINNNKPEELNQEEKIDFLYLMYQLNMIFNAWTFEEQKIVEIKIPDNIVEMAQRRADAKKQKKYDEADKLRAEIMDLGYQILDTKEGFEINKI